MQRFPGSRHERSSIYAGFEGPHWSQGMAWHGLSMFSQPHGFSDVSPTHRLFSGQSVDAAGMDIDGKMRRTRHNESMEEPRACLLCLSCSYARIFSILFLLFPFGWPLAWEV